MPGPFRFGVNVLDAAPAAGQSPGAEQPVQLPLRSRVRAWGRAAPRDGCCRSGPGNLRRAWGATGGRPRAARKRALT